MPRILYPVSGGNGSVEINHGDKDARPVTFVLLIPWAFLVFGGALAHLRLVPPLGGLILSALSAPVGLSIGAVVIVLRVRGLDSAPPWWMCASAFVPTILLLAAGINVFRFPRINDVTTNPANPPVFTAIAALPENRERDLTFPNSTADEIRRACPDVQTVQLQGDDALADRVYNAAVERARTQSGWTIMQANPAERELEAIAESWLFRFNDYVTFRVAYNHGVVSFDMRSKSRDGQSDLGVNAKRIRTFLNAVQALR